MTKYNQIGRVATTVASNGNGQTVVTYHQTNVVEFDQHTIKLNNGGYFTQTSKVRMNQAATVYNLGFQVYAKQHQWYVKFKGKELPYTNGMILDRCA